MGTVPKVYSVPGGEPEYTGSTNYSTSSESGGGSILTVDLERWVDPETGNDGNPGTQAQPWASYAPFATLLASYSAIHAVAKLHILPVVDVGTIPEFVATTVPPLGTLGKIVLIGEGVVENEGEGGPGTFVANASSTTGQISTDLYPYAGDPRGWIVECVAGTNRGMRRLIGIGTATEGGPATLIPSALLDHAGIGDTWRMIRPAAQLSFDSENPLIGSGRGSVASDVGSDPGVYIANLQLLGQPTVLLTSLWLYCVEIFSSLAHNGGSFDLGDQCLVGAGVVFDEMPWIDPDANFWNGCGLTSRYDETLTVSSGIQLSVFGPTCEVNGYFCGTAWRVAQNALAALYGGALWGTAAGTERSVVEVTSGGRVSLGTADASIATGLRCANTPAPDGGVVYVHDPDSVATVGHVQLAAAAACLLRASDAGTINVDSSFGAPAGSSTAGDAQDATGGGTILWDTQPALTAAAGAQLRVTGLTGSNADLATVASGLVDALGLSRIIRRATSTPATANQQRSPALPPFNAGSIFVEVAAGVSAQAIAAPPAGFLNVILSCACKNDGAVAGVGQLTAGGVPIASSVSIAAGSSGTPMSGAPYPAVDVAVTAVRQAGTTASLKFFGEFIQIPKANVINVNFALTAAFQSLAALVPPAGWVCRPWSLNVNGPSTTSPWAIVNDDTGVSHTASWQITRGALVIQYLGNSTNGPSRSSLGGNQFPVILPGDVVEVKANEAITIAGSVAVCGVFELVRQAA